MPVVVQTVLLLVVSNVFMTFAWYSHLKELREKITAMDKRAHFALTDSTTGGPLLPATGVYWYADLDARLNDAVLKVLARPEVKERFATLGVSPLGSTPEQFATFIRDDFAKWTKVISDANIKAE